MVMTAKSINRISLSGGLLTQFWIIFQFIYQFLGDKLAFSSKITAYNIYKEGFTLHMDALDIRTNERPLKQQFEKIAESIELRILFVCYFNYWADWTYILL